MPGAPIGSIVTLTYDMVHQPDRPDPDDGDWLVGYSERTEKWTTAYLILGARQVRSTKHPRRFQLRCRKIGPSSEMVVCRGERVYPIVWYSRSRRKRQ